MAKILVLHGPNLNLLGNREANIYGSQSLSELNSQLTTAATPLGHNLTIQQSNAEHLLVEYIQNASQQKIDFIIINPAAYTHTSIALRDALLAVKIPFIEVHISNIFARETFRHHSFLSDIALGVITGLGTQGYILALSAADHYLKNH